ncbi:uncharacterized protein A4U43_C07F7980 [Asparagus officinalis]|uniref:Uncharacterized protein n=1 Tax=Asparagus officinalis TaxID=4686 RepID=A0A5P1EA90_ASPOF|nr:uncharacterized protein A4U43_C07F7980 [Asparagus officinalis]
MNNDDDMDSIDLDDKSQHAKSHQNWLLTEARVEEAREIDAALAAVNRGGNGGGDGSDGVGELMDMIIREWQD